MIRIPDVGMSREFSVKHLKKCQKFVKMALKTEKWPISWKFGVETGFHRGKESRIDVVVWAAAAAAQKGSPPPQTTR